MIFSKARQDGPRKRMEISDVSPESKFHTAAGVYKAHPYPLETILLSIILEHEKMIGEILGELKEEERGRN